MHSTRLATGTETEGPSAVSPVGLTPVASGLRCVFKLLIQHLLQMFIRFCGVLTNLKLPG